MHRREPPGTRQRPIKSQTARRGICAERLIAKELVSPMAPNFNRPGNERRFSWPKKSIVDRAVWIATAQGLNPDWHPPEIQAIWERRNRRVIETDTRNSGRRIHGPDWQMPTAEQADAARQIVAAANGPEQRPGERMLERFEATRERPYHKGPADAAASQSEPDPEPVDLKIFEHARETWKYGPRYWLKGLLSPGLCVLAGAGGGGKSTLAASLVIAVASGAPDFCGIPIDTPNRKVLLVSNEEQPHQAGRRLEAAKLRYEADTDALDANLFAAATKRTTTPEELGDYMRLCGTPAPQLVVIDSYSTLGVDTNSEEAVQDLAMQLKAYSKAHGVTFLIIAHPSKSERHEKALSMRGNDRFFSECDTFLYLADDHVLHNPKSRDSIAAPPRKVEAEFVELGRDVHGHLSSWPAVTAITEIEVTEVGKSTNWFDLLAQRLIAVLAKKEVATGADLAGEYTHRGKLVSLAPAAATAKLKVTTNKAHLAARGVEAEMVGGHWEFRLAADALRPEIPF